MGKEEDPHRAQQRVPSAEEQGAILSCDFAIPTSSTPLSEDILFTAQRVAADPQLTGFFVKMYMLMLYFLFFSFQKPVKKDDTYINRILQSGVFWRKLQTFEAAVQDFEGMLTMRLLLPEDTPVSVTYIQASALLQIPDVKRDFEWLRNDMVEFRSLCDKAITTAPSVSSVLDQATLTMSTLFDDRTARVNDRAYPLVIGIAYPSIRDLVRLFWEDKGEQLARLIIETADRHLNALSNPGEALKHTYTEAEGFQHDPRSIADLLFSWQGELTSPNIDKARAVLSFQYSEVIHVMQAWVDNMTTLLYDYFRVSTDLTFTWGPASSSFFCVSATHLQRYYGAVAHLLMMGPSGVVFSETGGHAWEPLLVEAVRSGDASRVSDCILKNLEFITSADCIRIADRTLSECRDTPNRGSMLDQMSLVLTRAIKAAQDEWEEQVALPQLTGEEGRLLAELQATITISD